MPTGPISVNESKNAFFSIKTIKCPGQDEINFNVKKSCFGEFCEPLQYLFNLSFERKLVIIQNSVTIDQYLYLLECVMCNRLYKYVLDSNILYKKQFGFHEGHSTDHAILQQIRYNFE